MPPALFFFSPAVMLSCEISPKNFRNPSRQIPLWVYNTLSRKGKGQKPTGMKGSYTMKKIEAFENAIANEVKDIRAIGINSTMFWAYRDSQEAESDLLNFSDVIWDKDIAPIVESCREYGIHEFTISSTFSSLIETLAEFEKLGCKLAGLTTVKTRYTNWQTGEKAIKPAVLMKL